MPSRAYASLLQSKAAGNEQVPAATCQCPHGLMPHCYLTDNYYLINAFSVSMPSRAYASLLRTGNSPLRSKDLVSMPSRAYASLLQYPFKNLGFMRFPEPVFAGICQNILAVTHFHAC